MLNDAFIKLCFYVYVDVNECENDSSNDCSINADCINTEGSYDCVCLTGYTGDGSSCSKCPVLS